MKKLLLISLCLPIFFILLLIGLQFIGTKVTEPTHWQEFNQSMLQSGKGEKVVIVNKEVAQVYIKKEYLGEEKFRNTNKEPFGNSTNNGPHFYFEIGSVETFNQQLNEAQTDFDNYDKISVTYKTKKDVSKALKRVNQFKCVEWSDFFKLKEVA